MAPRTGKRSALLLVLSLVLASTGTGGARRAHAVAIPHIQPNLLFILTDDQRWDTMDVMPSAVKNFPVDFSQAILATPLCCPSRTSFLTGEYPHTHGVWTNHDLPKFHAREQDSLGPWLQAKGYMTGFVGRYLNRFGSNDPTPPGWDEFYARVGNADGRLVDNGYTKAAVQEHFPVGTGSRTRVIHVPNKEFPDFYMTDYFAMRAVQFLEHAQNTKTNPLHKPWALVVWTNAPHLPIVPAPKYAEAEVPAFHPPPSFLEPDMRDKPPEVRARTYQALSPGYHEKIRRGMLRMLRSVDDLVAQVWQAIDGYGLRSRTYGLFASDNGFFWGEHRKTEKVYAYEEAARVPFRMAVPGMGPTTFTQLVQNVDFAPTWMALAGDTGRHHFDGTSLLPIIQGTATDWRDAALIEARSDIWYDAVRTQRWTYIHWVSAFGERELYDLWTDPYELNNVAAQNPDVVAQLESKLLQMKAI